MHEALGQARLVTLVGPGGAGAAGAPPAPGAVRLAELVTGRGPGLELARRLLADAWVEKFTEDWRFGVDDGAFVSEGGGPAHVFEVSPTKVLGFAKGDFAQTSYRFD